MNMREPFTLNMRSTFQELMDRPDETRMEAYRDPAWRGKVGSALPSPPGQCMSAQNLGRHEQIRRPRTGQPIWDQN